MRSHRSRALLAAVTTAVACASPSGAQAVNVPHKALCTFNALTTWQTPVAYIGGGGQFYFNGKATCIAEESPDKIYEVVPNLQLAGSGTFNNTLCGTGTADGTFYLWGDPPVYGQDNFHVQFVAGGAGELTGSYSGWPVTSGGTIGYVQATPGPSSSMDQPPFGTCATQLTMRGAFVIQ